MNLKDYRKDFEEYVNNVSNEEFEQELIESGINKEKILLNPVSDLWFWKDVPKWKFVWWDFQCHIIIFFWKLKMIILRRDYK